MASSSNRPQGDPCQSAAGQNGSTLFKDTRLEQILRDTKGGSASNVYEAIVREMRAFAPLEDDLTIAVIKKM